MASVYQKRGRTTWFLRVKDAAGRWQDIASTAATKTEAKRLAADLERKAERQRFGLEPFPTDCKLTVGELVEWWLRERCPAASQEREKSRLRKNVIATRLGAVLVRHLTSARVDDHLHELERAGAAPASVNHVRAKLRTVFFKAKKAGLWAGPNPILETEPRRVPKRVHPTLRADEIAQLLDCVPPSWRSFTATAIFAGLRKGELCGLQKADVDLDAAVMIVRRSYDHETTKGGHADLVPISPVLDAYLRTAIDESPSDFVFPWPDGSMRSPECDPEKVLRRALAHAGLVERYEHSCRCCKSHGTPHVEKHEDAALRRCPTCNAKLWPKAIPRPMRFHDLRHTAATLMLRAGVDAHRVQRILRHASVTTTTGTYGHLALDDLREAVSRIGPAPFADSLLTAAPKALPAPKHAEDLPSENRALQSEPRGDRTHDPRLKRPVLYQLS
jgi:integrase